MAWNNSSRVRPGHPAVSAILNRTITNLLYLRGQDAGQTDIDTLAPFLVPALVESTHATALGLFKRWETGDTPEIHLIADIEGTDGIEDGYQAQVDGRLGITGGSSSTYGSMTFERTAEGSGKLSLWTLYDSFTDDAMVVLEDGSIGVLRAAPDVAFDIGGDINVSGGFYQGGILITDWTFTGGSPNKVSRTGNAKVLGRIISTLPTGTAPLAVSSAVEVANLDVDRLDDHAWHGGVIATGDIYGFGSSDSASSASLSLDKAGKWAIFACGVVWNYAAGDQGKVFNAKIKTSGGTQIGATAENTLENLYPEWGGLSEGKSFFIAGSYTAAGVTTVRVEFSVTSGTGSDNNASATILALWLGP